MVDSPLLAALEGPGLLVLDGAMATELERHGADLSGGLWSARLLLDQPELIARVHRDYFEAGADVAITASYQASVQGFARLGISPAAAERLIQSAVSLAVTARDEFWAGLADSSRRTRPLVATSVGPYGAVLADGSEYRGDYDLPYAELVRFHRDRLEVLVAAGVEVLACETIPSLLEARAMVEALSGWPEVEAWLSFSARNGHQVSDGTSVADCAAYLHDQDQIVAVGVNCTDVRHISDLVRVIAAETHKPIVVYPNTGETYDVTQQSWRGSPTAVDFGALAREWHEAGARLIGGCCRTRPADIRAVAAALKDGLDR
ncbi:MAG: homocysteine S-methyltransferase [Propionibacteriaceae bacterium]